MVRGKVVLIVSGLMLSSACGGKSAAPETTVASSESDEKSAAAPGSSWEPPPLPTDGAIQMLGLTGPDKPWDQMNYEEKEWYMVGKVHPVMRQVFQTFDHDKYEGEKFECTPCHDEDPARKYKMPNPKLSAVPAYGSEDWKAMENSRVVKFMVQRVTPVTAQLLGEQPFDPATGQGFSCWGCHPKE